jgi:hypothetical protein
MQISFGLRPGKLFLTQALDIYSTLIVANTGPINIQADLLKYGILLRPERDFNIWMTLCMTIYKNFDGRIETLLDKVEWDGPRAIELIRSPKYKEGFINLKGRKIAPLWLRMLKDSWSGHALSHMEDISLPIDGMCQWY